MSNKKAPEYIKKYLTQYRNIDIKHVVYTGKLKSLSGNTLFKIKFYGDLMIESGLIFGTDFSEELIYAIDINSGEKILLFDGCIHGYDNMFCEEYTEQQMNNREATTKFMDEEGNEVFEIEITYFYNISYEDEKEEFLSEDGQTVELINGDKITFEQLKNNGFDAFGIDLITPSGKRIEIHERELA